MLSENAILRWQARIRLYPGSLRAKIGVLDISHGSIVVHVYPKSIHPGPAQVQ